MLVSIFIPSYNHAQFLATAIESCLNQTYKNIEIIIVDDNSSDDSLEIARRFEKKYPSLIQVFTHPDNLNHGISATINLAVSKLRGDFYCGLASDDIFYPDKTERQVNYLLEHPDVGWVYSKAERFGERSGLAGTDISTDPDALATLIRNNRIWEITVMGRKEVWNQAGAHDESLVYSDWHFAIRMLEISKVGFIDEALAGARVHSRNTSVGNNWKNYFQYSLDVMTALRNEPFEPRVRALVSRRRYFYLFLLALLKLVQA
jgi:alpha-1,3-rhamnosyltransferase